MKVYKDNQLLNELKTVFNVTEKSAIEQYMPYAPYAGGGLALLVIGMLLVRRRR